MNTKRQLHIDIIAGFCILYMINVHLSDWNWNTKSNISEDSLLRYLYVPFMSWFFYKAGMFYKDQNIKDLFLAETKKLIKPFLLLSIVGHLLYCIRLWVEFGNRNYVDYVIAPFVSIVLRGSVNGNFALWFLPSLFLVKIIYNYFVQRNKDWAILIVSFLVSGIVVYLNSLDTLPKLPGKENVFFPIWMANVPMGLCFYCLGHKLKDIQYNYWSIIIAVLLYGCHFFLPLSDYGFRTMTGSGSLFIWAVTSLSFLILLNNIAFRFPLKWLGLHYVGENSMLIYIWHWPLLTLSRLIFFSVLNIPEGWTLRIIQSAFLLVCFIVILRVKKNTQHS